jgi:hypothetical protein
MDGIEVNTNTLDGIKEAIKEMANILGATIVNPPSEEIQ